MGERREEETEGAGTADGPHPHPRDASQRGIPFTRRTGTM